jgi:hypothetical protein
MAFAQINADLGQLVRRRNSDGAGGGLRAFGGALVHSLLSVGQLKNDIGIGGLA